MLYMNVRGLILKIYGLKELIMEEQLDVLGIVETMLEANEDIYQDIYTIYIHDRKTDVQW